MTTPPLKTLTGQIKDFTDATNRKATDFEHGPPGSAPSLLALKNHETDQMNDFERFKNDTQPRVTLMNWGAFFPAGINHIKQEFLTTPALNFQLVEDQLKYKDTASREERQNPLSLEKTFKPASVPVVKEETAEENPANRVPVPVVYSLDAQGDAEQADMVYAPAFYFDFYADHYHQLQMLTSHPAIGLTKEEFEEWYYSAGSSAEDTLMPNGEQFMSEIFNRYDYHAIWAGDTGTQDSFYTDTPLEGVYPQKTITMADGTQELVDDTDKPRLSATTWFQGKKGRVVGLLREFLAQYGMSRQQRDEVDSDGNIRPLAQINAGEYVSPVIDEEFQTWFNVMANKARNFKYSQDSNPLFDPTAESSDARRYNWVTENRGSYLLLIHNKIWKNSLSKDQKAAIRAICKDAVDVLYNDIDTRNKKWLDDNKGDATTDPHPFYKHHDLPGEIEPLYADWAKEKLLAQLDQQDAAHQAAEETGKSLSRRLYDSLVSYKKGESRATRLKTFLNKLTEKPVIYSHPDVNAPPATKSFVTDNFNTNTYIQDFVRDLTAWNMGYEVFRGEFIVDEVANTVTTRSALRGMKNSLEIDSELDDDMKLFKDGLNLGPEEDLVITTTFMSPVGDTSVSSQIETKIATWNSSGSPLTQAQNDSDVHVTTFLRPITALGTVCNNVIEVYERVDATTLQRYVIFFLEGNSPFTSADTTNTWRIAPGSSSMTVPIPIPLTLSTTSKPVPKLLDYVANITEFESTDSYGYDGKIDFLRQTVRDANGAVTDLTNFTTSLNYVVKTATDLGYSSHSQHLTSMLADWNSETPTGTPPSTDSMYACVLFSEDKSIVELGVLKFDSTATPPAWSSVSFSSNSLSSSVEMLRLKYAKTNPRTDTTNITLTATTLEYYDGMGNPGKYDKFLGANSEGLWFTETEDSVAKWAFDMVAINYAPVGTVTHMAVLDPIKRTKRTMWVPVELDRLDVTLGDEFDSLKWNDTDLGPDFWTARGATTTKVQNPDGSDDMLPWAPSTPWNSMGWTIGWGPDVLTPVNLVYPHHELFVGHLPVEFKSVDVDDDGKPTRLYDFELDLVESKLLVHSLKEEGLGDEFVNMSSSVNWRPNASVTLDEEAARLKEAWKDISPTATDKPWEDYYNLTTSDGLKVVVPIFQYSTASSGESLTFSAEVSCVVLKGIAPDSTSDFVWTYEAPVLLSTSSEKLSVHMPRPELKQHDTSFELTVDAKMPVYLPFRGNVDSVVKVEKFDGTDFVEMVSHSTASPFGYKLTEKHFKPSSYMVRYKKLEFHGSTDNHTFNVKRANVGGVNVVDIDTLIDPVLDVIKGATYKFVFTQPVDSNGNPLPPYQFDLLQPVSGGNDEVLASLDSNNVLTFKVPETQEGHLLYKMHKEGVKVKKTIRVHDPKFRLTVTYDKKPKSFPILAGFTQGSYPLSGEIGEKARELTLDYLIERSEATRDAAADGSADKDAAEARIADLKNIRNFCYDYNSNKFGQQVSQYLKDSLVTVPSSTGALGYLQKNHVAGATIPYPFYLDGNKLVDDNETDVGYSVRMRHFREKSFVGPRYENMYDKLFESLTLAGGDELFVLHFNYSEDYIVAFEQEALDIIKRKCSFLYKRKDNSLPLSAGMTNDELAEAFELVTGDTPTGPIVWFLPVSTLGSTDATRADDEAQFINSKLVLTRNDRIFVGSWGIASYEEMTGSLKEVFDADVANGADKKSRVHIQHYLPTLDGLDGMKVISPARTNDSSAFGTWLQDKTDGLPVHSPLFASNVIQVLILDHLLRKVHEDTSEDSELVKMEKAVRESLDFDTEYGDFVGFVPAGTDVKHQTDVFVSTISNGKLV